jgi:hypothetical protein
MRVPELREMRPRDCVYAAITAFLICIAAREALRYAAHHWDELPLAQWQAKQPDLARQDTNGG